VRANLPALNRPLRAIDLFCGAGGLTAGLKAAGYDVAYALDKDQDSCDTYARNHPEVTVECRSITTRTPKEIAELAGGPVDLIVGGPSCQSFSTHGRKNGWVRKGDPRNDLWRQMLDVTRTLRPQAFLLENVPGLVYWKQGEFGATILDEFHRLGYRVSREILLAADHGVPQRRRRLFIVGLRGDEPFQFPAETHLGGWRRDTRELWERRRQERGLYQQLRTWEAIGDLPPLLLPNGTAGTVDLRRVTAFARRMRAGLRTVPSDHDLIPISADHLALIQHVPPGGTWRDIPPHLLPDRYRGMRRTDSTNLLARLAPDLPAYTITTQFNNVTTGCFTHPYEDRSLTVREAARLQTFRDSYGFEGATASKCRQVGNAVPPLLAQVLVAGIANAILGEAAAELHPGPEPIRPAAQLPAPPAVDARTRRRMRKQAKTNTKPELEVRAELRKLGLRYRVDLAPVPSLRRRADVLFPTAKVAVFVHGCFWHGCPEHARATKSNTKWWADKIAANQTRDADTQTQLLAAGWLPIIVWEHEAPKSAASRVAAIVGDRLETVAIRAA
jgi:DNA (cytosine-5)-methyltransferase 1